MSVPYLFRCPISLEIFTDPVTLSTGQTYDRPSIEKWLADGNRTCPVSMQRLTDTTLIPNQTLRHLIDQWLLADCRESVQFPHAADFDFSVIALRQNLLSPTTSPSAKLDAARKIHVLSVESDVGRACLIQLGFFPLLLQLLFRAPGGGAILDAEFAGALLNSVLSLSVSGAPLDSLNMLKEEEAALSTLVHLFDRGNAEIKISLCHLLEVMASSSATRELCSLVGQSLQVLQILVSMLSDKSSTLKASEAAVRAMAGLCSSSEGNRRRAIGEGAVDGLVAHLLSNCCARRNAAPALAALELLLELEAGKKALVENPSGVRMLVKMVFRVSTGHEGSEHALGLLLAVCGESERAMEAAVGAGVVTQSLLLLQSQCGAAAKAKARALLKMLRASWHGETKEVP